LTFFIKFSSDWLGFLNAAHAYQRMLCRSIGRRSNFSSEGGRRPHHPVAGQLMGLPAHLVSFCPALTGNSRGVFALLTTPAARLEQP
jgi:hypothetical protein